MNAPSFLFGISLFLLGFSGLFDQTAFAQGSKGSPISVPQSPGIIPGTQNFEETMRKNNEEFQRNISKGNELSKSVIKKVTEPAIQKVSSGVNYFFYARVGASVLCAIGAFFVFILKPRPSRNAKDLAMNDPWIRAQLESQNRANGASASYK